MEMIFDRLNQIFPCQERRIIWPHTNLKWVLIFTKSTDRQLVEVYFHFRFKINYAAEIILI